MEQSPLLSTEHISHSTISTFGASILKNFLFFLILLFVTVLAFYVGRHSVQNNNQFVTLPTPFINISPTNKQIQPTQAKTQNKECKDSTDCDNSVCLNGYCVAVDKDMVTGIECQKNSDCGKNEFCFQSTCQQSSYCRFDSDCEIGGACQSPCSGNDCTYASGTCGVRTKLNYEQNQLDDIRGCMASPCRAPNTVKCINNQCTAL